MLQSPGGLPHRANTVENTDEKYISYGKYRYAVSCTGDCTVRNFIVIPNISLKVALLLE